MTTKEFKDEDKSSENYEENQGITGEDQDFAKLKRNDLKTNKISLRFTPNLENYKGLDSLVFALSYNSWKLVTTDYQQEKEKEKKEKEKTNVKKVDSQNNNNNNNDELEIEKDDQDNKEKQKSSENDPEKQNKIQVEEVSVRAIIAQRYQFTTKHQERALQNARSKKTVFSTTLEKNEMKQEILIELSVDTVRLMVKKKVVEKVLLHEIIFQYVDVKPTVMHIIIQRKNNKSELTVSFADVSTRDTFIETVAILMKQFLRSIGAETKMQKEGHLLGGSYFQGDLKKQPKADEEVIRSIVGQKKAKFHVILKHNNANRPAFIRFTYDDISFGVENTTILKFPYNHCNINQNESNPLTFVLRVKNQRPVELMAKNTNQKDLILHTFNYFQEIGLKVSLSGGLTTGFGVYSNLNYGYETDFFDSFADTRLEKEFTF
ncbi:auxilin isoform a [Anaeramoeba ignava]|uniref:Auxilin isoform a n=1 Tax=Anaeramoeba ignava TaxID=1746090 RepID=A0A9Q0R5L2_ANAIG|nr:auxilin isoform a [Anaeramoeba ignava]